MAEEYNSHTWALMVAFCGGIVTSSLTHFFARWRTKADNKAAALTARARAFDHFIGELEVLSHELAYQHLEALHRLKKKRNELLPALLSTQVYILLLRIEAFQVDLGEVADHRVDTSQEAYKKLQTWLHRLISIAKEWAELPDAKPAVFEAPLLQARRDGDIDAQTEPGSAVEAIRTRAVLRKINRLAASGDAALIE